MKNNLILFCFVSMCIGFLAGGFVWGINTDTSKHKMSDGTVMSDNTMDMDSMMKSMTSGISNKTGDEFDQAFLSEMIVHHRGAVDMASMVIQTSKRPELLKLANDIISAQNKEINMMKNWQTQWFH